VVVRCTRKLLDLIGTDAAALNEPTPTEDDWYGNLLWLDRRKCLLLTHAGTLFSIFRADVRNAPLGATSSTPWRRNFETRAFHRTSSARSRQSTSGSRRRASRSTLGVTNEMAFHIRYQVEAAAGLDRCDTRVVNRRLRRTLHSRGGDYAHPIDLVARWRPAAP